MKNSLLICTILSSLLLSACAFNGNDTNNSDEARVYKDNRDELIQKFSQVTGVYEGTISTNKANSSKPGNYKPVSIPVQMAFFTEDVATGKDSNGESKILPALKLRYRQLDAVSKDNIIETRYLSASGELTAASTDGSVSVRGIFKGQTIEGEVFRSSGKLGNFSVRLVTKDVDSGFTSDQGEYYDRVLSQYKELLGSYKGRITPVLGGYKGPNNGKPYDAELKVELVPAVVNGSAGFKLQATFFRPQLDPSLIGPRRLDVIYEIEFEPALLVMTGNGSTPTVPDAHLIEIAGTLENGVYTAEITNRLGSMGKMVLKKVQ
jgi:hypothetical protein